MSKCMITCDWKAELKSASPPFRAPHSKVDLGRHWIQEMINGDKNNATIDNGGTMKNQRFTLIELLVVIAIIAIVVTSKAGFFLQFSAIFAFKAL